MKTLINLTLAAVLLTASIPALADNPVPLDSFAAGGTAVGTTLSYVVVSEYSKNAGTPVVTAICGQSDKEGALIQFYSPNTNTYANYVNSTVTIPVAFTNGFGVNDIIVIRHKATDTYERRVLTTSTGSTNLVVTSAPTTAVAVGDTIYRMATDGAIRWNSVTNTITASDGFYAGLPGKPVLVELDCTSVGVLQLVKAKYERVPLP